MVNRFEGVVTVSCEATVGGERVYARKAVSALAWDDPVVQELVKQDVRSALIHRIAERWPIKVTVSE